VGHIIIYFSPYKKTLVFKSSTARTYEFQKEIKEAEEKKMILVIKEKSIMMKGNKNKH
jgi:hypothetical protein